MPSTIPASAKSQIIATLFTSSASHKLPTISGVLQVNSAFSVDTVKSSTKTDFPKLFFNTNSTPFSPILASLQPISELKIHLLGNVSFGFKTAKYKKAPTIIVIAINAQAYVVKKSKAA